MRGDIAALGFLLTIGIYLFYFYYPLDYDKSGTGITGNYLNYQCSSIVIMEKAISVEEGYRICSEAKSYETLLYIFILIGIVMISAGFFT
jgi:hypothetical protein